MSSVNKLQEIIHTTLTQLREMVGADTIIGTPINTDAGITIVPISKVTVGFATSGLEFNDKGDAVKPQQNFGAVGGSGISVAPIALLCINQSGKTELINIGMKSPTEPIELVADIIDRAPDLIEKIKNIFSKPADDAEIEENETPKIEE